MKTKICLCVIFASVLLCKSVGSYALDAKKNQSRISCVYSKVDSVMRTEIPDKYVDIMLSARHVNVRCSKLMHSIDDTCSSTLSCNRNQMQILKYVLVTANFSKETVVVYGKFSPCIEYQFYAKKSSCAIQFDFGLMQFRLLDENKEIVGLYSMKDKTFVALSHFLFPDDEFINFILKQK